MEDEQQMWLLGCLNAILDPNIGARNAAEEALSKASLQQGYGVALAKVIVNSEYSYGLRQLAAVLLKQYVKQHWVEGENYVPPTVSPQDKERIRSLLLLVMGDPEKKIRTAVGMAVGSIAISDWPEEWPDLMVYLLDCINDRSNVHKVNGAMRCLSLFASEVDDRQLPHLVPVLFPALYNIVSSASAYDVSTRRRALFVLHSAIATLGMMSGAYQPETRALMQPMLKAWMEQFAAILSSPIRSGDPDSWCVPVEAVKSLLQIVQNFPQLAFSEFSVVLGPLWQAFVRGLQVYEEAAIKGGQETEELADSDGNDQSLEAFAIQLLEFLVTLVDLPRYCKMIKSNIKDIAYYTMGYIQITEEQVQSWSSDATQFLAEEENLSCSCRTSGVLLLQQLVESYGKTGIRCIMEALNNRIEEARKAKAQGDTCWWKLREAALLALGSCIDIETKLDFPDFNLAVFVDQILSEDLSEGTKLCPFLYGRALWIAAKFSSIIANDKREKFLFAALEGLTQDYTNVPIMIGSCQVISEFLPKVDPSTLQPHLKSIYLVLTTLLQQASEETLHITLEALKSAIKADKEHLPEVESMLSPLLLNVWGRFISDPLIGIDALETLEVIKKVPGYLEPLALRILPSITNILRQPQNQESGLVAGALDLLTMLLKDAPMDVIKHAYDGVFTSVIGIVLHTDDHSEMQNATECLAMFVRYGGAHLLSWANDANIAMKMLLDAAARLLSPETDSSGALFAGKYVVQLIEHFSSHMAPYLRDLVAALVARLETATLKGSLLFVFAKLVHMSAPNYGQFIELLMGVPSKNHGNALNCVMSEWTKHHGEIQGSYQIKVSTTALASLLASGHPMLSQVHVQGHLVQSGDGIKTRSRAKVQPDQFTSVSLAQKIFSLLAEAIIEGQEAVSNFVDEEDDDDWEELSNGGEDENDESSVKRMLNPAFQPLELYEHLLNGENDDENDDDDDSEQANDPISQMNLQAYLVDFMKRISCEAPQAFQQLFQGLSDREKTAVKSAITR